MQFLVTRYNFHTGRFEIVGDEAFHIAQVLRKKPGDTIQLFDGKNAVFWGKIEKAAAGCVAGRIIKESPALQAASPKWPYDVSLYQALPKGEKWDWVLQKGCEMGITRFIPVISKRTVVKLGPCEISKKTLRWRRILESAAKQSGVPRIPEVAPPAAFPEAVDEAKNQADTVVFAWESESGQFIWTALSAAKNLPQRVAVFIGPEGGWEPREAALAREAGFLLVSLGPYLLRTETAALAAVAMIHALLGRRIAGNEF